jgi:hypothetical protein
MSCVCQQEELRCASACGRLTPFRMQATACWHQLLLNDALDQDLHLSSSQDFSWIPILVLAFGCGSAVVPGSVSGLVGRAGRNT